MKCLYTSSLYLLLFLFTVLVVINSGIAQCPDGQPEGGTAYDTTILLTAGIVSKDVKFPQFDPQAGMVTCVRLCVTIKGIVDTVALQNFSSSSQVGSYTYDRTDQVMGPGMSAPITSSANLTFGPFPLTAYDGLPGAGSDFYSAGSDTVLTRVLCHNISDSATIVQFYGTDSVAYDYDVNASAIGIVPGGSSATLVLSSALVNFRFEYCTCPSAVLPLNIHAFNVLRLGPGKVELNWTGYDDLQSEYHYEVEMSKNGKNFSTIGALLKGDQLSDIYRFNYMVANGESGMYYFRIKQVYANGYVRYSNIRQIELETSVTTKFSVYPNPSKGIVGIKFDNKMHGHFKIQIYNTQGQVTVRKELMVSVGSPYLQVGALVPGVYWLRVTDEKNHDLGVTQLLIK